MYDILFCASTYKSVSSAVRFLRTSPMIGGKNLMILVSPNKNELYEIGKQVEHCSQDYILLHTSVNSLHFGRGWAYAWAKNNGVEARYVCSCDDDLEWNEYSAIIPGNLDWASIVSEFSMMGMHSTHPRFPTPFTKSIGNMLVDVTWIDGNCMFSRWADVKDYGVVDAPHNSPMSFYVEMEYCFRMRQLSGRPIVFLEGPPAHYIHHFRDDPAINSVRGEYSHQGEHDGSVFYADKFGVPVPNFLSPTCHPTLLEQVRRPEQEKNMKKHLVFEGLWNDWEQIYNRYKDKGEGVITWVKR